MQNQTLKLLKELPKLKVVNGNGSFDTENIENALENVLNADGGILPGGYNHFKNLTSAWGNVNSENINIKSFGQNYDEAEINPNPYLPIASLTKVIGAITAAKLMEMGYFNLDTEIHTVLGSNWSASERSVIVNAGTTAVGLTAMDKEITVYHLLSMSAGMGYDFYYWGNFSLDTDPVPYDFFDPATKWRVENYGYNNFISLAVTKQHSGGVTSVSNPTPDPTYNFTTDSQYSKFENMPHIHQPGNFCQYGEEYCLLGYFMDKVIKEDSYLSETYGNVVEFTKQEILKPIGVTDFWMVAGQSQPPRDVESRMMSAAILRLNNAGIVDPSYNNYYGIPTYVDGVTGDSYYSLMQLYKQDKDPELSHVGNYGFGGACSIKSLAKILRVFINEGLDTVTNKRILSKASMNFLYEPSVGNDVDISFFALPTNPPLNILKMTQIPFTWGYGVAVHNQASFIKEDGNGNDVPTSFPFTAGSGFWGSYFKGFFYFNRRTGNYIVYSSLTPTNSGLGLLVTDVNSTENRNIINALERVV